MSLKWAGRVFGKAVFIVCILSARPVAAVPEFGPFTPIRDGYLNGVEYSQKIISYGVGTTVKWKLKNTYNKAVHVKISFKTAIPNGTAPCDEILLAGEVKMDDEFWTSARIIDAVAKVEAADAFPEDGVHVQIWPGHGAAPTTLAPPNVAPKPDAKPAPPPAPQGHRKPPMNTVQIWLPGADSPIEFSLPESPLNSEIEFGSGKTSAQLDPQTRALLEGGAAKVRELLQNTKSEAKRKALQTAAEMMAQHLRGP